MSAGFNLVMLAAGGTAGLIAAAYHYDSNDTNCPMKQPLHLSGVFPDLIGELM